MVLRTYLVSFNGDERLVKAVSLPRAVMHVISGKCSGWIATKDDLERLLTKQVEIEIAE